MDNNEIKVVLAFCDPKGTYARHGAVTITSIFANTTSRVAVYVIHDDTLTEFNKNCLREIEKDFLQKIVFIDVSSIFDETTVDTSKLAPDGSKGTLFRLLIPDIIDEEKIIYLDCDIIVNIDIAELWAIDLSSHACASIPDVDSLEYRSGGKLKISWQTSLSWKLLGIKEDSYFNAGVMLMNLKKIREGYHFLDEVSSFYSKFKNCITMADQDCLNHIFRNDCMLIDERYNRIRFDESILDKTMNSIWHMAGTKPWETCTRPGVDDLYWHYLAMTPYSRTKDSLIRVLLHDVSSSHHLHSAQCVNRLKKQLYDNIFRCHIIKLPFLFLAWIKSRKM
ncbi:MAG: glycosyltransferase family 8 protein [Synergistaceae bacterium]|nr:glycosyltransferase family 8 protein [Synergistaceae bacterium]